MRCDLCYLSITQEDCKAQQKDYPYRWTCKASMVVRTIRSSNFWMRLVIILCKGLGSECYLSNCLHAVSVNNQPSSRSARTSIDTIWMNDCGFVPIKLYLWTLKCEFHIILKCHEVCFKSYLREVETEAVRDRDGDQDSTHSLVYPQLFTTVGCEYKSRLEPGTQCRSPRWRAGSL